MPLPPKLQQKYLARLDELIQEGGLVRQRLGSFADRIEDYGRLAGLKAGELTTDEAFNKWHTSTLTLLSLVLAGSPIHTNTLLQFQNMSPAPAHINWGLGRMRGIREDLDGGYLQDITASIEAELAGDYMGQAEGLLAEGQSGKFDHVPAAVLAGAVLEKALRTLCDGHAPPISTKKANGEPKTMNPMIDDLKKAGVYNEMKAKQLRAWAGVRNHAAHGEFDQFKRGDVEDMISGINRFLGDYLG